MRLKRLGIVLPLGVRRVFTKEGPERPHLPIKRDTAVWVTHGAPCRIPAKIQPGGLRGGGPRCTAEGQRYDHHVKEHQGR